MTEDMTRSIIALIVIVGFFSLVLIVLLGFVDIRDPTIAKLVGALVGYVTAVLNPIIFRYFNGSPSPGP
jgi:hypothetical protein